MKRTGATGVIEHLCVLVEGVKPAEGLCKILPIFLKNGIAIVLLRTIGIIMVGVGLSKYGLSLVATVMLGVIRDVRMRVRVRHRC